MISILKYNNKVNYNIYNVDQMVEKINRIKSDNINNNNNNNNKLSLIDDTIVTHDNINYNKINKNIDTNCYVEYLKGCLHQKDRFFTCPL